MKSFSLFAAAVAMICVCEAASEAANSARDAARQYGAAVRNCDMAWAVDSMYPPLRRTYADQLTSRTREAEIARARRVQGLDKETKKEAKARMAASDKALRAKYARMGEDMKKRGLEVESYTVGSAEWCLKYADSRPDCISLMDNGHYHPTEVVSDKISAVLAYDKKMALHVTRGVRWDSDHVVLFDDETKELCKEIVRCGIDKVFIALDYFDASINRISAWATGFRNLQKALMFGMLQPQEELTKLQNEGNWTKLMVIQEELKTMPFGDIWDEYCRSCGKPVDGQWFSEVEKYEAEVLSKRN